MNVKNFLETIDNIEDFNIVGKYKDVIVFAKMNDTNNFSRDGSIYPATLVGPEGNISRIFLNYGDYPIEYLEIKDNVIEIEIGDLYEVEWRGRTVRCRINQDSNFSNLSHKYRLQIGSWTDSFHPVSDQLVDENHDPYVVLYETWVNENTGYSEYCAGIQVQDPDNDELVNYYCCDFNGERKPVYFECELTYDEIKRLQAMMSSYLKIQNNIVSKGDENHE
jgi:hypothetical protein